MEFWAEYSDGLAEVIYNEKLNDMLRALEKIRAESLLGIFQHAVNEHLSGIELPLNDGEVDEAMQRRIDKAEKLALAMEVNGRLKDEFYGDIVCYLLDERDR